MADIFDFITAQDIVAYWETLPTFSIPYFGDTIFPYRKQVGTDISWLLGSNGLPVAITPSNYDAKATLRERTGFQKVNTEMAFFREAYRMGEKDRQFINNIGANANSAAVEPILRNIFDDVTNLLEGVRVQNEYMRMQLLQYGRFQVTNMEKSCVYNYDYQMPTDHQFNASAPWDQFNDSNPVMDILTVCDYLENSRGVRPSRIVMNRVTLQNMTASKAVRRDFSARRSIDDSSLMISDDEMISYIESKTRVRLFVYSKLLTKLNPDTLTPDSTQTMKYIDDGKVVFLPDSTVGWTRFGTTPEESDLTTGNTDANVSVSAAGPTVMTYKEPHPVNMVTIVSATCIPSFERINDVAVLDV